MVETVSVTLQTPTIRHSHSLHTMIGQLCGGEKEAKVRHSLSSSLLLSFVAQLHLPNSLLVQRNERHPRETVWKYAPLPLYVNNAVSPLFDLGQQWFMIWFPTWLDNMWCDDTLIECTTARRLCSDCKQIRFFSSDQISNTDCPPDLIAFVKIRYI